MSTSLEFPVLRLGLVGFGTDQQEEIALFLKSRSGPIAWETWPFDDADAWWVNGARVQLLADGVVRVPAAEPTRRATQLNLNDVDRPLAFTRPLACGDIQPFECFDRTSPDSAGLLLAKFEAEMQPLAAQSALAGAVAGMQGRLISNVYHVMHGGSLLAVVDFSGNVGVSPTAAPLDFSQAEWIAKADADTQLPGHFVRATLQEVMWRFAIRTTRDRLPTRYRKARLYFRHSPRVSHRLLKDTHLVLIRELASQPATFEELQQRTGLGDVQMARALAALYFVGSITSNPRRAAPPRTGRAGPDGAQSSQHSVAPSVLEAESRFNRGAGDAIGDRTAPAPLRFED